MPENSSEQRRYLLLAATIGYLGFTLCLGLRQFMPGFRSDFYGSTVGEYNMFTNSVRQRTSATLIGPRNQEISVPYQRFLWRNPLISTTHSHLQPAVVRRFAAFLAGRKEVRALLPVGARAADWRVVVTVSYSKNGGSLRHVVGMGRL